MVYSNIALNQIDSEDRLFYLHHLDTDTFDWDGRQNLFNPIWLQEKRPRSYRIVDGFTVFRRAKAMAFPGPIPAKVFPEDSSLPELWKLRVQKRKWENNLSCMAYLQGLASMMAVSNLTAYPDTGNTVHLLPEIGRQVFTQPNLTDLIDKSEYYEHFTDLHQLGYREVCQLNEKPKQVLIDLSMLLDQMQLKGKKLTSMILIIDELKRGYNIPLSDLLKDPQLVAIRNDFPGHQRYRHIKTRLLSLRFPELSRLQREWDETIKKTGLGSLITIQHDPYFEDDCLQILLSARNPIELKQLLQQILKKTEAPELEHLFSFV